MVCLLTGGFSFLTYAWTDAQQFDELVHEWSLESLGVLLAPRDRNDFALEVIVFIHYNFTGFVDNDANSVQMETLGKYGVGWCGLPGFMVVDAYMDLELDKADLFGATASIFSLQESFVRFSRFKQPGDTSDIIVANRRIDIAIQKVTLADSTIHGEITVTDRGISFLSRRGSQISHCTISGFGHNYLRSLEDVLLSVEKEQRKLRNRRRLLAKTFLVTLLWRMAPWLSSQNPSK
ncbi:hypothetical protein V8E53_002949 [Lactarius tabidus]